MFCEELIENFVNLNLDIFVEKEGNIALLLSDKLIKKEIIFVYRFPSLVSEDITIRGLKSKLFVKYGMTNLLI